MWRRAFPSPGSPSLLEIIHIVQVLKATELHTEGASWRSVADATGLSVATLRRLRRRYITSAVREVDRVQTLTDAIVARIRKNAKCADQISCRVTRGCAFTSGFCRIGPDSNKLILFSNELTVYM